MKTLRLRKAYSVVLKETVLWVAEPICLQDWSYRGCVLGTAALQTEAKKDVLNYTMEKCVEVAGQRWNVNVEPVVCYSLKNIKYAGNQKARQIQAWETCVDASSDSTRNQKRQDPGQILTSLKCRGTNSTLKK